jgi:hypothetical protein
MSRELPCRAKNPMSATRGNPGTGRSGANRRGREKRRGRNEAAEARPWMVNAPSLERWRGNKPQERSRIQEVPCRIDLKTAGRKAWNSEGEMKFKRGAHRSCNGNEKRTR